MNIEEVTAVDSAVRPKRKGKKHIDVGVRGGDHFIALFLAGTTAAAAVSLYMLHIDWLQLAERSSGIVEIFWKMAHMTTDSLAPQRALRVYRFIPWPFLPGPFPRPSRTCRRIR